MNRALLILLVLLLAGGGAFLWWRSTHAAPVAIVVRLIDKGKVEAVVANTRAGTVEALRRSKIAPQTGGQVSKLNVKKGQRVQEGEILIELWNLDLRAQIALAESEALRARAQLDQIVLMADISERESRRMQELKQAEISSEERTDRMVAEAKAKHAEVAAARATVLVAGDRIATAKAALERTILKAPFAGVVAEVNAELGEYVTPSPPGIPTLPAIDLIDTQSMHVKSPIDEVDAHQIAVGLPARITLDAFPGRRFAGKVTRIAPYVLDREKEARTVDVEVEFSDANEAQEVLPGASADVEIVLRVLDSCVRVPTEAILEGKRVLVYREADRVLEERVLVTGLKNWEFTEVKSGLAVGDRVVVSVDRQGVKSGAVATPEDPR